jgi:protein-disulfide isomerase
LVMLAIGLLSGYFLHPLVASRMETSSAIGSARPTGQAAAPNSPGTPQAQAPSQGALEVMEALTSETRHFIGDPDAPVVMIEFSDFQ